MTGSDLAVAAEALVGVPFRLHGRDPATGLDCVGVLAAVLARYGHEAPLPGAYSLRMRDLPGLASVVANCGFRPWQGHVAPGDVLLVRPGPCQVHIVVAANGGRFVHAHAGHRRVVTCDRLPDWPILHHWRLAADN